MRLTILLLTSAISLIAGKYSHAITHDDKAQEINKFECVVKDTVFFNLLDSAVNKSIHRNGNIIRVDLFAPMHDDNFKTIWMEKEPDVRVLLSDELRELKNNNPTDSTSEFICEFMGGFIGLPDNAYCFVKYKNQEYALRHYAVDLGLIKYKNLVFKPLPKDTPSLKTRRSKYGYRFFNTQCYIMRDKNLKYKYFGSDLPSKKYVIDKSNTITYNALLENYFESTPQDEE